MDKIIMKELLRNGYEVYRVGGCVRDGFLGIETNDIDLVTNANIEEMNRIFKNKFEDINYVGKNFGVLIVNGVEVAQFRTDIYDDEGIVGVEEAGNLYEDSKRRDFTINALYEDLEGNVLDPEDGLKDISNKVVKSVGNPDDRFREDPSRILRAVYLACKLGFDIDKETSNSMIKNKELIKKVPNELVGKILNKVIYNGTMYEFFNKMYRLGLVEEILPEVKHILNLEQNDKYHDLDVFEHSLKVLKNVEKEYSRDIVMLFSGLLHDVGKGLDGVRGLNKEGKVNDIGHEKAGRDIAENVVIRLGFGKDRAERVGFIVENHGYILQGKNKEKSILKWLRKLSKEFDNLGDFKLNMYRLVDFMDCDRRAFNKEFSKKKKENLDEIIEFVYTKAFREYVYFRNQLEVDGSDVVDQGIVGRDVGKVLDLLIVNNIIKREESLKFIKGRSE